MLSGPGKKSNVSAIPARASCATSPVLLFGTKRTSRLGRRKRNGGGAAAVGTDPGQRQNLPPP